MLIVMEQSFAVRRVRALVLCGVRENNMLWQRTDHTCTCSYSVTRVAYCILFCFVLINLNISVSLYFFLCSLSVSLSRPLSLLSRANKFSLTPTFFSGMCQVATRHVSSLTEVIVVLMRVETRMLLRTDFI